MLKTQNIKYNTQKKSVSKPEKLRISEMVNDMKVILASGKEFGGPSKFYLF